MITSVGSVYCLDLHRDYACQSSGVCCTSGWPIAVERQVFPIITEALGRGELRLDRTGNGENDVAHLLPSDGALPEDAVARLGQDERGSCLFFEARDGRRCSIHRQLGESVLPTACRQFPRTVLIDDRGAFVSLSHYCPTAARMLLRDDARGEVVADPPGWASRFPLEGLDARGQPPPLLRPGVFFDWKSLAVWERICHVVLGREDLEPGASLALLRELAQAAREWRHRVGSLGEHLGALERDVASRTPEGAERGWTECVSLYESALAAVPREWQTPSLAVPRSTVRSPVPDPIAARAVRRYLLARLYGSWCWYQGRGVASIVASLETAFAVFTVELARRGEESAAGVDDVIEAIRRSDRLLLHLARPELLAASWSRREEASRRRRLSLSAREASS